MERLGHRLRQRRIAAGESASELAKVAGWTQTYWHLLEDGARQAPGPEQIYTVARALAVSASAALLADLALEATWWEWTRPRNEDTALRLIRAICEGWPTAQDEAQWQYVLRQMYPAKDPGRRNAASVPDADRTRPETWPRVLMVDILCARVAALRMGSSSLVPSDESDPVRVATEERPGITAYVLRSTDDPTSYEVEPITIDL